MTLDAWMLMMPCPSPPVRSRSLSLPVCADSVTNANTTTTEVNALEDEGRRRREIRSDSSECTLRRSQTFTSEVRLPPVSMTLSCRQTRSSRRFTFASPRPVTARSSGYSYSGCASHYADCRSAADTGSRVNVNHCDPPICWRDPQNKVLIHTYRICIECEPS
jgi:hypothetical protein